MKNNKIITIIVLLGIIISLLFINLNLKNKSIEKEKIIKEQLGTTGNDAYILMQKHTSEVQEKEQKLVSFKSVIARAITDMGIATSENADADTMANNIKNITSSNLKNRTNKTKIKYFSDASGTVSHTLTLSMTKSGTFTCFVTLFQSAGVITSHSLNVTKNNQTISYSKIILDSDGLTDRLSFVTTCDFKSGDIIKVTPSMNTENIAYGKFIIFNYSY